MHVSAILFTDKYTVILQGATSYLFYTYLWQIILLNLEYEKRYKPCTTSSGSLVQFYHVYHWFYAVPLRVLNAHR